MSVTVISSGAKVYKRICIRHFKRGEWSRGMGGGGCGLGSADGIASVTHSGRDVGPDLLT